MSDEYLIYVRARNGSRLALLNDVNDITIVEKLNDPGNWDVSGTTSTQCPFVSGSGIVIIRNGEVYYTGVLKQVQETYDAHTQLYTWKAQGASDLEFLSRRICYPDPETGATDVKSHYTDSGTLGDVVKRLIDLNLGVDAKYERQEPLLEETVISGYGQFITISLRFQNLLDTVSKLLETQNYSIRPKWNTSTNKIHYEIVKNVNKLETLIFSSELNSVLSLEYLDNCPTANYVISAGEGQMTERSFATAINEDSVNEWGRIEYYHDMRATSNEELQSDADMTLNERSMETVGYNAELALEHFIMTYKNDWNIGDTVGVSVHGKVLSARILQVETHIKHEGVSIDLTIGTRRTGQLAQIFDEIKKIRSDVNQLRAVES